MTDDKFAAAKIAALEASAARRAERVLLFITRYEPHLRDCQREMPEQYGFSDKHIPVVVGRMRISFLQGSYNHDGPAIKRTCRELGIKHTRKAMEAWFNDAQP